MIGLVAMLQAVATPAPATPTARSADASAAAEQVVQRQLDAYNSHDIDAFAATYAEDVAIYAHPGRLMAQGKSALRAAYGPLLQQLRPIARVVHRTVMGDQVTDVETITAGGREHCCAVAVYKVENGLITRVDLIASPNFMRER